MMEDFKLKSEKKGNEIKFVLYLKDSKLSIEGKTLEQMNFLKGVSNRLKEFHRRFASLVCYYCDLGQSESVEESEEDSEDLFVCVHPTEFTVVCHDELEDEVLLAFSQIVEEILEAIENEREENERVTYIFDEKAGRFVSDEVLGEEV